MYDRVYQLQEEFPHLKFTINGGIKTLTQADEILKTNKVYGCMLGRTAYENPYELVRTDQMIYGYEDKPIPSREEIALNPVICFIGIQGFAFNCTASSIMPAINTVALASILWIIQFLLRGSFTSRRRIPRSTTLFLTSCRKCSSCFLESRPAPSSFA